MGGGTSKHKKKTFLQSYIVGRELGSGAFSVVKLAIHKETRKESAVKLINKRNLSAEDSEALAIEIKLLGELKHPNIIELFETFDEGNEYYIVTELVQGGELFDRIVSKTHYTEKEARDLVKLFLQTIDYIHSKGIVHRDLKPENLLLVSSSDDSAIKIADFGFAKKVSELSSNEMACGTPGYVAPEVLRGDKYGTEVDIWSMGVITYVLLSGYPPFYDEDQKKLFKKIKAGSYYFHEEYWANTSPDAIDLIKKMICVDQKERHTAKQLLNHPWITAGDDVLASKDLSSSIVTMKRFNARRRLRAAAHAVILSNRMSTIMSGLRIRVSQIDVDAAKQAMLDESPLDDDSSNPYQHFMKETSLANLKV